VVWCIGLIAIVSIVSYDPPGMYKGVGLLAGAQIDAVVLAAIKRSCADCHSNTTHYPWYSYVAPVSWLIRNDVKRGRERLNLSEWSDYSDVRRQRYLSEIANQIKNGEMPLRLYTLVHRDARLSKTEVDAIFQWTQTERTRLIMERTAR
jgi:hypothetical protein